MSQVAKSSSRWSSNRIVGVRRELANRAKSRVSQPWHYGHFGPDNSLLQEAVLNIVEYLAEPLASANSVTVAHPLTSCNN